MRSSRCRCPTHLLLPCAGVEKFLYPRRQKYPASLDPLVHRAARARCYGFGSRWFFSSQAKKKTSRVLCSACLSRTPRMILGLCFCHARQWPRCLPPANIDLESCFHPRRKNLPGVLCYVRLPREPPVVGYSICLLYADGCCKNFQIPGAKSYPACFAMGVCPASRLLSDSEFVYCAQMAAGRIFKFQAEKFTRQALL